MSATKKTGAATPRNSSAVMRAAMDALRGTISLTRAEQARFRRQLARRLGGAQ